MTALITVLVIAAAVGWLAFTWYRAKKRREAIQRWAAARGWTFEARSHGLPSQFGGAPFEQGEHRRATNVVRGELHGRPVIAFEYAYDTHRNDRDGRRHTVTHDFAVLCVGLPRPAPRLTVEREGMLGTLARAVGIHDIELENEDFNHRFKVTCPDRKFAYDVLHPRLMESLLQGTVSPWRMDGQWALHWREGGLDLNGIDDELVALTRIVAHVPDFVWTS